MEFINFKGKLYPEYQSKGNAAQWILPFAKEWCKGEGYDIGCNRAEWAFPGSKMIDITMDDIWDAYTLPEGQVDYIFSSHCLEHLADWVGAIEYWGSKLKSGGTLFLYLPHKSQEYWHPVNNRKHLHSFDLDILHEYYKQSSQWNTCMGTDGDLNHSFPFILIKK